MDAPSGDKTLPEYGRQTPHVSRHSRKEAPRKENVSMQMTQQANCALSGLSSLALRNVKTCLGRLDRTTEKAVKPDLAPIKIYDRFAFDDQQSSQVLRDLANFESPDGFPYNRRQAKFDAAREQLDNFLKEDTRNGFYNKFYRMSLEQAKMLFSGLDLEPEIVETEQDAQQLLTTLDSGAGYEGLITGRCKKKDYLGHFLEEYQEGVRQLRIGKKHTIANIAKIDAAVDWVNKTWTRKERLVNPVCLAITLATRRWSIPLDHAIHAMDQFGVGKDDSWLTSKITWWRMNYPCIVGFDYSKYDSSEPAWLIRDAFNVMYLAFKPGTVDKKEWDNMVEDFCVKTFLYMEDGTVKADLIKHGNPSGHPFTTALNCVVNLLILGTIRFKFNLDMQVNITGDDSVCAIRNVGAQDFKAKYLKGICNFVTKFFGIKLKDTGTKVYDTSSDEQIEYLSREWTAFGPARDIRTVIEKMMFPRYYRKYVGKGGLVKPEFIVYAAILCYPVTMRENMDVAAFEAEYNLSPDIFVDNKVMLSELPYNMRELFGYYGTKPKTYWYEQIEASSSHKWEVFWDARSA